MQPLTDKQKAVLDFIRERRDETGYPPTVREIARRFGYRSPKAAADHLAALERKGQLQRIPGRARGLMLLEPPDAPEGRMPGIPILGDVAAGFPILAEENMLGTVSLDSLFGQRDLFAVRVRGDSMVDEGILEGDLVIVRRSPVLETNSVAVVYLEGEATVKRVVKAPDGFALVPGNRAYATVSVTAETPGFAIAGPVVGVVRQMR